MIVTVKLCCVASTSYLICELTKATGIEDHSAPNVKLVLCTPNYRQLLHGAFDEYCSRACEDHL